MISKDVIVISNTGLHARPAALLVKAAAGYKSDVFIEYNGRKGNAKSILGVLALGVNAGSIVKVVVKGEDEKAALEGIVKLIETMKG